VGGVDNARIHPRSSNMDAHPEDAFIAAFLTRVAFRCATREERELAQAIALAALDHEPELAYPWGRSSAAALLQAPIAIAQQRGVARGKGASLMRELVRWLAETDRLDVAAARPMCRGVGVEPQARALLAA
jgi:hypothetical protein